MQQKYNAHNQIKKENPFFMLDIFVIVQSI